MKRLPPLNPRALIRPRRRGAVLAIVLWLMVIMVIVAMGLAYDTQVATRGVGNSADQARAYYAAMSGLERFAAELDDTTTYYTAPGQTWELLESDQEMLSPEVERFQYMVMAVDNCSRVDLNQIDQEGLAKVTELSEEQVTAIVNYRTGGTGQTTTTTDTTSQTLFRSLADLLTLPEFTADQLYGATNWAERLSPSERFRQDWARLQQANGQPTTQEPTGLLSERLTVGARARHIGADGLARFQPGGFQRDELEERLKSVSEILPEGTSEQTPAPPTQGGQQGQARGGNDPVRAALAIANSRNLNNWSEVWTAVNNNRNAVRLLADILTLPNDGATSNTGGGAGGNNGGGGGGVIGGGPGGGGRPGGGPGGGGGGGRPGGGPGGGRPGGGPGGGGPGGGGGGGGGGFPGGGGGGGGRPGGGPGGGGGGGRGGRTPQRFQFDILPSAMASESGSFGVRLVQGTGGPGGTGQPGGTTGGTTDSETTVEEPEAMEGAINLNSAPPEVLMTLPQMTEEVAQAIVSQRESSPFVSRGDLLLIQQVTPAIFNAIIEKVTVVSDSYTVRALGIARNLDGFAVPRDTAVHLSAVIDRTTGRCRIVRMRQDN